MKSVSVGNNSISINLLPRNILEENSEATSLLTIPTAIKRCGFAMRLIVEGQTSKQQADPRLIQNIAKGYRWMEQLTSGEAQSIAAVAAQAGISTSHVTRMIYRACLAPEIVKSILDGTQPASLTSETLKDALPLPIDWDEQQKLILR